ncbi:30S ribosomal protein S15 [Buchnera aphidicola (Ceratovacuna keduensis)]|uniref:30S ribosomal protein S15 n=1 Tax=Buchnera aphidicola TaxID=9 RepID=UPI0031B826CC
MKKNKINSEIFLNFGKNVNDSGSTEVQIALITFRIKNLKVHFDSNKKDHSSKRGLLCMVSKRRKLLNYLKKKSLSRYKYVIKKLSIRR